jgi:hypothetical protein
LKQKFEEDYWCFETNMTISKKLADYNIYNISNNNLLDVISFLSLADQATWRNYRCSVVLPTFARDYQVCSQSFSMGVNFVVEDTLPLIAIMAGTTSRGFNHTLSDIPLFNVLFPSLLCTLDCGFNYVFVMGYDQGDPFYDSDKQISDIMDWFQKYIARPLQKRNILITLRPVAVINPMHRPGPVFTAIAREAYKLGSQYFYRVNDDSEFIGRWPKLYTDKIRSLSLPYGVIGPSCYAAKDRILTHDFVHRTHLDIFEGQYYPTEFTDWYMVRFIFSYK